MYDCAPVKARFIVYGDCRDAIRLSFCESIIDSEEVKAVPANLSGDKWVMASLMYGSGMHLLQCVRLGIQDLDFSRNEILVRNGKGAKDKMSMLPGSLKKPLQVHLKKIKSNHESDMYDGWGSVFYPTLLKENTRMIRGNDDGNGFSARETLEEDENG